jgi:hypothetical protein
MANLELMERSFGDAMTMAKASKDATNAERQNLYQGLHLLGQAVGEAMREVRDLREAIERRGVRV